MLSHIVHRNPTIALVVGALFVAVVLAEMLAYRFRGCSYNWREARSSILVAVAQRVVSALTLVAVLPIYQWLWDHRLWTLPLSGVTGFVVAFVAVEFAYYWMHRASHRISWMWATHAVHHSAQQLNFLAAIRLGATGFLSFEWLPFAALVVLGIDPVMVGALFALDLLYQFFLHSELLPRIDTHQWFFNTPSDHRVHHAVNAPYLDRNFGGMLIVFDRLFGTYVAERDDEAPRFGLLGTVTPAGPLGVLFIGWANLFARMRRAKGVRARLQIALGPP